VAASVNAGHYATQELQELARYLDTPLKGDVE
jgi:hypothetical protein